MKLPSLFPLSFLAFLLACGPAAAHCSKDGERIQSVTLSTAGKSIDRWDVDSNEIHRTTLANGFTVGLKIGPATAETYRDEMEKLGASAVDELVSILVYDVNEASPKLLSSTWGGANSRQGFGPKGGANRVVAIGEPGIELWLHKAVCVGADGSVKIVAKATP